MKSKLKAHWVIKLFDGANLQVKVGDVIEKGDELINVMTKGIKSFFDPQILKLSIKTREEINHFFEGKKINKGDLIYKTGSFFPIRIWSPVNGIFLKIDEFGNFEIEVDENQKKEIKSPMRALVTKIDDEKLILEFEAIEFKGEGIIEGKAWGESDFRIIDGVNELTSEESEKVIFVEDISQSFLIKAHVLGVAAIVTIKNDFNFDKINTSLPILALDETEWNELRKYVGQKREVLVNTRVGRLLIVVE